MGGRRSKIAIIFARTRHEYDSYRDFWELVRLSGFRTCYVDEMDASKRACYIVTPWNGELAPKMASMTNRRCRVVHWNLERFDVTAGVTAEEAARQVVDLALQHVDAVWMSDRSLARLDSRVQHAVLGGHPGLLLANGNTVETSYDVCLLAYVWGRRELVCRRLRGIGIRVAPPAYVPVERDIVLRSSRAMLNLHQYEPLRPVAPLRFAVAAAYGMPLFSEQLDDPYPLEVGRHLLACPYDDLVDRVQEWLAGPATLASIAGELQDALLSRHPFAREVRTAVEQVRYDG